MSLTAEALLAQLGPAERAVADRMRKEKHDGSTNMDGEQDIKKNPGGDGSDAPGAKTHATFSEKVGQGIGGMRDAIETNWAAPTTTTVVTAVRAGAGGRGDDAEAGEGGAGEGNGDRGRGRGGARRGGRRDDVKARGAAGGAHAPPAAIPRTRVSCSVLWCACVPERTRTSTEACRGPGGARPSTRLVGAEVRHPHAGLK